MCIPGRSRMVSRRRWPPSGVVKGDLGFYRAGVVKAWGVWLEAEVLGEGEKVGELSASWQLLMLGMQWVITE